MSYKVGNVEFSTFNEVIAWAWNNHKIDFELLEDVTHAQAQEACDELNKMLSAPDEDLEGNY
jgi:hypothetical protein